MTAQIISFSNFVAEQHAKRIREIVELELSYKVKSDRAAKREAEFDRAGSMSLAEYMDRFRAMEDVFEGLPSDSQPEGAA